MNSCSDPRVSWREALCAAMASIALTLLASGPIQAQSSAEWEAVGPDGEAMRLFTPSTGALLVAGPRSLQRSDDGGLNWTVIPLGSDISLVAVAPDNQDLLFAVGAGGVFRSDTGGSSWQKISDLGGNWVKLEISPASSALLYGVMITNPPADYGTNRWHEYLASEDGGMAWDVRDTFHERVLPGTQPCSYDVRALRPLASNSQDVVQIAGCTGRGEDPALARSKNGLRPVAETDTPFLTLASHAGAHAIAGGEVANPGRWYASIFTSGRAYANPWRSRLVRSDDDGASWETLQDIDIGVPRAPTAKPFEEVMALAVNPAAPDEVFAAVVLREPLVSGDDLHYSARYIVRESQDAGMTWIDLPELPEVADLALGIDGRYLYAATRNGVQRIRVNAT